MDEEQLAPASPSAAANPNATAVATEPNETIPATLEPVDLNELQELEPPVLQTFFDGQNFRAHPARNRHQQILDFIRYALTRNQPVNIAGFLEQPNDGPAMLRSPRLNFLPLPADVCVPHYLIRQFGLRPGQLLSGTVRLPRDREKGLALDRVISIEEQPVENWQAPTAFDNLTPLYPQGRILLENNSSSSISARAIDLLTPLGRGQRGLIVAPPRVGKTILLKQIAQAIRKIILRLCSSFYSWTSARKR